MQPKSISKISTPRKMSGMPSHFYSCFYLPSSNIFHCRPRKHFLCCPMIANIWRIFLPRASKMILDPSMHLLWSLAKISRRFLDLLRINKTSFSSSNPSNQRSYPNPSQYHRILLIYSIIFFKATTKMQN